MIAEHKSSRAWRTLHTHEAISQRLSFLRHAIEHGEMPEAEAKNELGQVLFRGLMLGMNKHQLYPDIYPSDALRHNKSPYGGQSAWQ